MTARIGLRGPMVIMGEVMKAREMAFCVMGGCISSPPRFLVFVAISMIRFGELVGVSRALG